MYEDVTFGCCGALTSHVITEHGTAYSWGLNDTQKMHYGQDFVYNIYIYYIYIYIYYIYIIPVIVLQHPC